MDFVIDNIEQLDDVAKWLVSNAGDAKVWFFSGDLGAGKTTLIQKICTQMGIKDNVVSPSFALINIYGNKGDEIYHIDLYRLDDVEEAIDLGIEDYFYSGNYCFVEWPGLVKNIAPDKYLDIKIEILSQSGRKIKIVKNENV